MDDSKNEIIEELKSKIEELERKIDKTAKNEEDKKPLTSLYSWQAPDRIIMSNNKSWYISMSAISILSIFFALIWQNYLLVIIIIGLIFIIYKINTSEPQEITNQITNKGIRSKDAIFAWSEIDYFWISERANYVVINFSLQEGGNRLYLLEGNGDVKTIISKLLEFKDYKEPTGLLTTIIEGKVKKLNDFFPTHSHGYKKIEDRK